MERNSVSKMRPCLLVKPGQGRKEPASGWSKSRQLPEAAWQSCTAHQHRDPTVAEQVLPTGYTPHSLCSSCHKYSPWECVLSCFGGGLGSKEGVGVSASKTSGYHQPNLKSYKENLKKRK